MPRIEACKESRCKRDPLPALVLIVDDNPVNLEVLSSTLLSAGLEVAIAPRPGD